MGAGRESERSAKLRRGRLQGGGHMDYLGELEEEENR